MTSPGMNVDPAETARFSELASTWWDPNGPSRALHLMNPVRMAYVTAGNSIAGQQVLDVGCGAGLLSEAMAKADARVTAIDAAPRMVQVAKVHALSSGLDVDYQTSDAETWCEDHAGRYDMVTCMELIEHVPDPASLLRACGLLVRPGGRVMISTINRTPKAWTLAVFAAEYVLGMLPRGTHDYERLVRPSELQQWGREAGLSMTDIRGLEYNLLGARFRLSGDVSVNYIATLCRDES